MKLAKRFFILLKKIFRFINLFLKNKIEIKLSNPKKTNILVIDHSRENEVQNILLNNIEFETFDTRIYQFNHLKNLRKPRVFLSLKIFFLTLYFFFIKRQNSLYNSYCFANISLIKPKIILDFSHYGFLLEGIKLFPKIKFFYVLEKIFCLNEKAKDFPREFNAFHLYLVNFLKKNKLNLDNLYLAVPGEKDIDIFKDLCDKSILDKINFIVSGSYKANYIKQQNFNHKKPVYDITYISQIMGNYLAGDSKDNFEKFINDEAMEILNILSKYVITKNLSCLILLRNFDNEKNLEKKLILSYFENYNRIFFKSRHDVLSSYKNILDTKVVISSHSQLTDEAMILDKKSFFIPLKTSKLYKYHPSKYNSFEDMWEWTLEENDYVKFSNKMDDLLSKDQKKYLEETKKKSNYIINLKSDLQSIILSLSK
tara:strand:+ start:71 stop:1348 length:1278 start_codon:yes stop_codon:yes gene_type:complete